MCVRASPTYLYRVLPAFPTLVLSLIAPTIMRRAIALAIARAIVVSKKRSCGGVVTQEPRLCLFHGSIWHNLRSYLLWYHFLSCLCLFGLANNFICAVSKKRSWGGGGVVTQEPRLCLFHGSIWHNLRSYLLWYHFLSCLCLFGPPGMFCGETFTPHGAVEHVTCF